MAHTLGHQGGLMLTQPGEDVCFSMGRILPEALFPGSPKNTARLKSALARVKYLYFQ
jgi:hypothetical protein